MEQIIFDEEYFRARAPILPGYSGVGLLGPTLMQWGTDEQKKKYLPRILMGDDIWCQGYSEPGAGSDLAGLQTRAELKGDYFVVNGQKVWTSGAQFADRMFLLARTDPDAPKHKGISYLILDDMRAPGVEVRPLVVMNGHHHFNEVFFDNVQIPKDNIVGPLNEGWKVAVTTLAFERGIAGGGGHSAQVRRLAEIAKGFQLDGRPAWDHEWVRQDLAQFIIECEAAKYTRLRSLTRRLKGLPPGPEGSTLKLTGSELGVKIAQLRQRVARWLRDSRRSDRRLARRPALAAAAAQLASVYDRGRHQRDPAQHLGRAPVRPTQVVGAYTGISKNKRSVPAILLVVPYAGDVGAQHGVDAGLVTFAGFAEEIEHVAVNAHVQIGLGLG